jgi:hypothetical protein
MTTTIRVGSLMTTMFFYWRYRRRREGGLSGVYFHRVAHIFFVFKTSSFDSNNTIVSVRQIIRRLLPLISSDTGKDWRCMGKYSREIIFQTLPISDSSIARRTIATGPCPIRLLPLALSDAPTVSVSGVDSVPFGPVKQYLGRGARGRTAL